LAKGANQPSLAEVFKLRIGDIVAIVGGGGKTSLMFALASQFGGPVISTTTTQLFKKQIAIPPSSFSISRVAKVKSPDIETLNEKLKVYGHCLIYGEIDEEKAHGVPLDFPRSIMEESRAEIVIVEADGSRMRPCKAPAEHEPAIPEGATLVIPTIGIDAFDHRVADAAHRPELVAKITQLSQEDTLTAEALSIVLTHPKGGLKNVPDDARVVPLINKVESEDQLQAARDIAALVLEEERIENVILCSLHAVDQFKEIYRRVTAVVLAAGTSDRMGATKQLLPWGERTVLGQTLDNLQRSRIHDIRVVVGHRADEIEAVARNRSVSTVFNADYEAGEMLGSLQVAVGQLPKNISAVLVVLADQPMVSSEIIDSLLERYSHGNTDLIAPVYKERRGNPVLIGRRFFRELLDLDPGLAPRHVLQRHPDELALVETNSAAVLQDLDRPEDYERWRPGS